MELQLEKNTGLVRVFSGINLYQSSAWELRDKRKNRPFSQVFLKGVYAELFLNFDQIDVAFEIHSCLHELRITCKVVDVDAGMNLSKSHIIKEIESMLNKPDPIVQGAPSDAFILNSDKRHLYLQLLGIDSILIFRIDLNKCVFIEDYSPTNLEGINKD